MNRTCMFALAGVLALSALATGCVTVPKEAPELSARLGREIQQTRSLHVAAVRMYFDEKRAAVDRFVTDEWLPHFATELFEQPDVKQAWLEVVGSKDDAAKVDFIRELGPDLQKRIDAKHAELKKPLDEMETALIRGIEDHYNQMVATNSALTGLLRANQEASETQKEIFVALNGGEAPKFRMDKVEEVTRLITAGLKSAEENRTKIDELVTTVGGD